MLGVAWIAADGRQLGSIAGGPDVEALAREAAIGLVQIFPDADHAVVYRGRTLAEGVVVQQVLRGRRAGLGDA